MEKNQNSVMAKKYVDIQVLLSIFLSKLKIFFPDVNGIVNMIILHSKLFYSMLPFIYLFIW